MAATSPYTPNDYQAVSNYRPYELPINDIFKGLSAQNRFWDVGADRVKSQYDSALNLKLSLEPNKEIRKKYLQDAETQLTKLSRMDLADASVQKLGFSVFKPLFQDEGIIYDDLTTRHYDKVRNDALMYRSKDNGKGYSDINFQYAMQGYGEFVNSKDRMAGKDFYNNRKEYTPYYDYTDDFSKALKDCKPSSVEATSPEYNKGSMSGYMRETYEKSLSSAQVKGCLESGLSPNGQRQLQIEGSVMYKGNIPVLASDTATYLSGVSGNYSNQLQQLSGQKAAIMAKKNIPDKDKAVMMQAIDEQVTALSGELDKTNSAIKRINGGDFTDVANNFEGYAGSMYSYKKLMKKALTSSFDEKRSNFKADPVQLNAIRFSQEQYLHALDNSYDVSMETMKQQHDKEMKLYDIMYGSNKGKTGTMGQGDDIYRNPLTGEITINPSLLRETPNLTDKPDTNKNIYQDLTKQVSDLSEQDNTNNLRLYNNFLARAGRDKTFRETLLKGFNYGTTDDEWSRFKTDHASNKFAGDGTQKGLQETPWFKTYTQAQPDDEDVNKWSYENTVVETGLSVINRKLEMGEQQVYKELGLNKSGAGTPEDVINKRVNELKTIKVGDLTVTAMDVKNALEGKTNGPITARRFPQGEGNEDVVRFYLPSGKMIDINNHSSDPLYKLSSRVKEKVEDVGSDIKKKRVEVYNKLGFDREPWYVTIDDKSDIVARIRSLFPSQTASGEDKENKNIKIVASDFTGGIKVNLGGMSFADASAKIRSAGIGTSIEEGTNGDVIIKGTTYNVVNQAINNPVLKGAAYQLSTIAETTAFAQTQPGAKVPNSDIKVPVMVRGVQQIMTIETYKSDSGPEYKVFLEGANTSKPLITASNAYELFEKIGRSPMDLNKPVK